MSSPKRKVKSSVNQQVKAGLNAIRDFLAGRSVEKFAATEDKVTREVVAAELLATMSGRGADEAVGESAEQKRAEDLKEHEAERERARQLFLDHGYFDEAVLNLRAANSATERAAAARVLGLVGSQRGTAHLVAAMFDDDPEVRRAAEEALGRIGDASVARAPVAAGEVPPNNVIPSGEVENNATVVKDGGTEVAAVVTEGGRDARGPREEVDASHQVGLGEEVSSSEPVDADSPGVAALKSPVPQTIRDEGIASEVVLANELMGATEVVSAPSSTRPPVVAPEVTAPDVIVLDLTGVDSIAVSEAPASQLSDNQTAEQPPLDEGSIREALAQLQVQLLETVALREELEQSIAQSTEREARLKAEAAARRSEDEELRKQADEKAERRRIQEREELIAEQTACARAETEAQRLAVEETGLRLKAAELRRTAERLARQREDSETARVEAAEAARLAAATRARDEAKSRHDQQLNQLRNEEEWLRAKTEEISRLHAEAQSAREKADAEAERLIEVHARMRAAEEARTKAEVERAQLEAEIKQKVEKALQLLDDTRRRGQEEQDRLEDEARRRSQAEQQRRIELEALKVRAEADSRELAELEQQTLAQVNSLRIADNETRKRIADAEVRRRAAEDAYRTVAEKVQRVEAEAHARAQEEQQTLAKLEAERRTVAVEAQSRADQEKRIREEIEMFRRLEEQERPRMEEAILERAQAEAHLQQQRQRLKSAEEARLRLEEGLSLPGSVEDFSSEPAGARARASEGFATATALDSEHSHRRVTLPSDTVQEGALADGEIDMDGLEPVAPAISAYLNSVDPYKRAAAVAELARSRPPDAFALITNCFDDHSAHVRNAAARALRKLEPGRTVDLFNRALEQASAERRRNIGAAIAASGVATEAIENLVGENREDTYSALSILFVMAKTGEIEPLERAIEAHPDDEIGRAVTKLLALSGHR